MPQLDAATFLPQLFWLAVSFGVLYLIVSRLALPRIGEVLQARRARIDADLTRAEELRNEAEATLAAYERAMAAARDEAQRLTAQASQAAAEAADSRHAALTALLDAETAGADARIAEARAQAAAEMRTGAAALVRDAGIRLTGVAPSDAAIAAALGES